MVFLRSMQSAWQTLYGDHYLFLINFPIAVVLERLTQDHYFPIARNNFVVPLS